MSVEQSNIAGALEDVFIAQTMDAVDLSVLAGFQAGQSDGEPDLVVELIDLYLHDAPQHLATIRAAAEAKDSASLKHAVHTLKGSSASIGIVHVAELCQRLEQIDCQDSPQRVAALIQLLLHKFAGVKEILAGERQRRFA